MYKNYLQRKSLDGLKCNGNAGLKWQRGCMFKVNVNLLILLIISSSKKCKTKETLTYIKSWHDILYTHNTGQKSSFSLRIS